MGMVSSFSELIDQWPTMTELAADLSEKPGTVRKWKQRECIPADRWRALLDAAKGRDIAIDETLLVRIADSGSKAA